MELDAIDEGEGEAVGEGCAKFFHEVKSEARAARAKGVEEADLRVESDTFCRADAVVREECVEEGEECVHGVAWWAAVAVGDMEVGCLSDEH